ncbi:MAG: outer membrane beta-barrel protein [Desulfococcaceae bacterium]|jgi:hypothetical protein|nr:outer membrane beta-barrel protein [Desulfococcaceae bacterium]
MKKNLLATGRTVLIFLVFFLCVTEHSPASRIIIQPLVAVQEAAMDPGGRLRIAPKVSASSRYDSNFYNTARDERGVFTYLMQPGIEMEYYTAKSSVTLGYTLDAYFYHDNDDVPIGQKDADEDDYVGHTFHFNVRTAPFAKLSLELDEIYFKTREESKADRFANDTSREKYYINRLTPGLFYRWNERFSSAVRYRSTITEYDRESDASSKENRGIFDLTYHFSPLSSLTLDYQIWDRNYDVDISDYTSNQVEMVYRKQAKHLGFEAGVGYHSRSFDDDSRDGTDALHYHAGLSAQTAKSRGELVFEENYNDAVTADDFYKARKLNLSLGRTFGRYLDTGISGFYQMNDYEDWMEYRSDPENREDDIFGLSASVRYKFARWLALGLEGGYEDRDSNLDAYDYDNKFIMLKVDSVYDAVRR